MAQEVIIRLIDDVDKSEAAGTVKFAFEGVHYEIDLSEANQAKFAKALHPYVTAARRTGGRQIKGTKVKSKTAMAREWAIAEGHQIGATGKVPKAVMDAYEASQG